MTTPDPAASQLRLLVGGLILVAGLLTIATVAAAVPWLSLLAGGLLLVLALVALRRGVARLLVAITLGFALVLMGTTVLQWNAEDLPAPTAADTVRAPAPILISGTVSESGRPLPDVPVQVTLWPGNEDVPIGGQVDTLDLPLVSTDARGRYVVTLSRGDVPHRYLMSRRAINFEIATTDPRVAFVSTSARYLPRSRAWVDALGDQDSDPKTLDFDLGSMEATETGDGPAQRWPLFSMDLDSAGS